MTYQIFDITINDRVVAHGCIDKQNNKFGFIPKEDEKMATILKYIVDAPIFDLMTSFDNGVRIEKTQPKDNLFMDALIYHLPRKYKVSNVRTQESDKSISKVLESYV
jgi:hypothetical protein